MPPHKSLSSSQSGQALVILLIFVAVSVMITIASVTLIVITSSGMSSFEQSTMAYDIAEAGTENALLRLLRNPAYTGETLTVGDGTATITVTGSGTQTITSTGRLNNYLRKIQVVVVVDDVDTIQSWMEVY
ncbi:MAG TPA: hypothetical protein DCX25_02250 [Candidatus Pacebacteria bacterium]|nr:hypothetical protein [Candidatus Paceibacterota bacterium]HCR11046.1 hypothetical protein [Candidatus Paceibacterota bacterium]